MNNAYEAQDGYIEEITPFNMYGVSEEEMASWNNDRINEAVEDLMSGALDASVRRDFSDLSENELSEAKTRYTKELKTLQN